MSNDDDKPDDDESNNVAGPSNASLQPPSRKSQFTWEKPGTGRREFKLGHTFWTENYKIGDPVESPLRYFSLYFTEKLLKTFADQTNQYYFRITGKEHKTSLKEMRKVFGASIVMVNLGYSSISRCWAKATRINRIANTISKSILQICNKFVITFYSPSCLGQETAKGSFGLRVKLPPAHLSTTHDGGFTLSL